MQEGLCVYLLQRPCIPNHQESRSIKCGDLLLIVSAGGSGEQHEDLDFFIPPPWAIAHHLIKIWAGQPSAWFSAKL